MATEAKPSFAELINSTIPVLVDFHADWCGPCKMLAPTVKQVAGEYREQLKVIKIDVDKNQQLSVKYAIRGVPTLILFKEGKILWQQSGVMSYSDLVNRIKPFLN